MSDQRPSAVDAIIEENAALRDEVDEVSEERDAASRQAADLASVIEERAEAEEGVELVDGSELSTITAERDSYLADSQRLAADFANYRKQSEKRVADDAAAQSAELVRNLVPVLDACDSAIGQDPESAVLPIRSALIGELERSGLELLAPETGEAFDPEQHEAVMHDTEAADDDAAEGPRIAEVFRAGYVWKGKVVRPAMVKVVG